MINIGYHFSVIMIFIFTVIILNDLDTDADLFLSTDSDLVMSMLKCLSSPREEKSAYRHDLRIFSLALKHRSFTVSLCI